MQQLALRKVTSTGLLAMSVVLGVAIAASVDTLSDEDTSAVAFWVCGAAAVAIAGAMAVLARITHWRPFERPAGADVGKLSGAMWQAGEVQPAALLDALDTGIVALSPQQRVTYSNPAFLRMWRMPADRDLTGDSIDDLLDSMGGLLARSGERSQFLLRVPVNDDDKQIKLELPLADGRLLTQQGYAVSGSAGATRGHLWVFEDVTVERHNAKQLVQLAQRDALTGQYNRHRFNEEIARMMADAQRRNTRLALLFFDLDGFKHINDTFGHRAGDITLIRIAGEVAAQVRRNEIFARIGGDEFAILVPDAADDFPKVLAERLTRSISLTRTEFEGQTLRVTCSCGIAVFPDHAATPDALVACADAAMYEAKEAGKNTWRFYRAPADAARPAQPSRSPDARVIHALENNLLTLHYQGIYATQQRTLRHYEALLRVRDLHSADASMLTSDFIAMAEKSGRIVEIDRWVLRQAIGTLARDSAIPGVAVNISGRSLDDDKLPAFIEETLRQSGVPARRLMVELTETAAVSDLHDARRFIQALQAMGCGVSLDDFGTGFSSFAYLKHLQVDSIKIDGLFIRDLPGDYENQLFVRAIVAVARGLHRTTIAECVEDEVSLKILAALGVDYVQGFYLEIPQPRPCPRADVKR